MRVCPVVCPVPEKEGQGLHADSLSLPTAAFHVFCPHGVALPSLQKWPGGHRRHSLVEAINVEFAYRPAGQAVPCSSAGGEGWDTGGGEGGRQSGGREGGGGIGGGGWGGGGDSGGGVQCAGARSNRKRKDPPSPDP